MATIKDIAKAAGVSVTTVSRALNNYPDVSESTKRKIKSIADELNYSPNSLARSLVMNKTKTIGLLVSGLNPENAKDSFIAETLCGINDSCSELGYDLVLFSTNTSKQKKKTYAQLCRERRVEGVITQGIKMNDPYLQEVIESDIPCVFVDIPMESKSVGFVTTDNRVGCQSAVKHLVELGHKHIAMINGHNEAFVSKERLEGYRAGLEEEGIEFNWDYVRNGNFEKQTAEEMTKELLVKHPEITAVFCASDLMALGVIDAAKKLEMEVPKDLSVVGYDDIILATYSSPPLTTIAQDKYGFGFEAAKLLVDIIEENDVNRKKILNSELIIRQSTAKSPDVDAVTKLDDKN